MPIRAAGGSLAGAGDRMALRWPAADPAALVAARAAPDLSVRRPVLALAECRAVVSVRRRAAALVVVASAAVVARAGAAASAAAVAQAGAAASAAVVAHAGAAAVLRRAAAGARYAR